MTALCDDLPSSTVGLSEAAARQLHLAGLHYSQDQLAEQHLAEAMRLQPEHLAVQVGCYRYLFYKGRLAEALRQLEHCMAQAAPRGGLPSDWRRASRRDADFASLDALWPRFYLFALKALGYLEMRLGNLEAGRLAVAKALELDPDDKVGARILIDVLDRQGQDDYA